MAAEPQPKRPREEPHQDSTTTNESDDPKRHKPYSSILTFLDQEEEEEVEPSHEPSQQDLTALLTTLQQELSSSGATSAGDLDLEPFHDAASASASASASVSASAAECGGDEDETAKSVMRHLLEASDDELGIPNRRDDDNNLEIFNPGENFTCDFDDNGGLWEIEDEAANYYTVLQSELFM